MESEYPLFVPPEYLAEKGTKDWSAKEAREYKVWMLGVLDDRVEAMMEFLGEPTGANPAEHLAALGRRASSLLREVPFSEESPTGRQLTNAGHALAADMGLATARYLLCAAPDRISWDTVRRPKADLSYNMPVLKGFSSGVYLDPVGGSIAEACGILYGKRRGDAWRKTYEHWLSQV